MTTHAAEREGLSRVGWGRTECECACASNALAAGLTTFELARITGTSISMIEAHYGALIDTAHDAILTRLDACVVDTLEH